MVRKPRFATLVSDCLLSPTVAGRVAVLLGSLLAVGLLSGGCGYASGEILYILGVGRGQKVEARFRLTDEPILVLVDDPTQLVDRPTTRRYLTDKLAQELIKKKAAKKIIPPPTLDALRQREPDLHRRGCREVGEMVGAKQVLWVEIRDFLAQEQIESAAEAAYITVSVKVISTDELEVGRRSRLWPVSPKGRILSETLGGSDCLRLRTKDAIGRELADKLATQVARLFYDHRLERLESFK